MSSSVRAFWVLLVVLVAGTAAMVFFLREDSTPAHGGAEPATVQSATDQIPAEPSIDDNSGTARSEVNAPAAKRSTTEAAASHAAPDAARAGGDKTARLLGRVVDEFGNPVSGAEVRLTRAFAFEAFVGRKSVV